MYHHSKYLLSILSLISSHFLCAQAPTYWQQRADYDINVSLNENTHIVSGDCNITYINNSPDTLRYVYVHLYPNAYKTDKSAFARQMVENGKTKHYFSKLNQRSYIKGISFTANGNPAIHSEFNGNPDIVLVDLPEPLLPGGQLILTTPFETFVGREFSRMGHENGGYHLTQWYPKIAVYDKEGWHPLPYLDQGEFYADFGRYNVNITVPKNFIVAATGVLQNKDEIQFLKQRQKLSPADILGDTTEDRKYTGVTTEIKKLQFIQDSVIDFAWFANKRYLIEQEQVSIAGKTIDAFIYYLPENEKVWKGGSKTIAHTLKYYSEQVGAYPYSHASAVDGGNHAGNGMEYPMITYISGNRFKADNDFTIIHEVGHNWFQGILANNERQNAHLDEGCNTFYDQRCSFQLDQSDSNNQYKKFDQHYMNAMLLRALHFGTAENIATESSLVTESNYYRNVYGKWERILTQIETYLGEEVFKQCMQQYFKQFAFKHPTTHDMQQVFETISGKDLKWAFVDLYASSTTTEFKLSKIKSQGGSHFVMVTNKSPFQLPNTIIAYNNDATPLDTINIAPFQGRQKILLPQGTKSIVLDPYNTTFDFNQFNNRRYLGNKPNAIRLGFKFLVGREASKIKQLAWLPILSYNYYDGIGIGLMLHNVNIMTKGPHFYVAPSFALNSKKLIGSAGIHYNHYLSKGKVRCIRLENYFTTYNYNGSSQNRANQIFAPVQRNSSWLHILLRPKQLRKDITNSFFVNNIYINQHEFDYEYNVTDSNYIVLPGKAKINNYFRFGFQHKHNTTFNPYDVLAMAESNKQFLKVQTTFNFKLDYYLKNKALYGRLYLGRYVPLSDLAYYQTSTALAGTANANNDYTFSQYFVARSAFNSLANRQIMQEGAFLKVNTYKLSKPVGSANHSMIAVNLASDIPLQLPIRIRPFVDGVYYTNKYQNKPLQSESAFDAGLQVSFLKDALTFYVPLVYSKNLKEYIITTAPKGQRILSTISFSIKHNIVTANTISDRLESIANRL